MLRSPSRDYAISNFYGGRVSTAAGGNWPSGRMSTQGRAKQLFMRPIPVRTCLSAIPNAGKDRTLQVRWREKWNINGGLGYAQRCDYGRREVVKTDRGETVRWTTYCPAAHIQRRHAQTHNFLVVPHAGRRVRLRLGWATVRHYYALRKRTVCWVWRICICRLGEWNFTLRSEDSLAC